jgi:hypothetical protein
MRFIQGQRMASDPPKPPDAFLSYTRFDDEYHGGAISEFCRRLANAVRAVTGVPFEIFQDVEGIGVGEHWPDKLNEMLSDVRFFIPILTPNYFTSKPCLEELEKFLRAEIERGRNDPCCQSITLNATFWRTRTSAPPTPCRARCTNASGRTGASCASSRSTPVPCAEPWSGWLGTSARRAAAG